VVDSTVKLLHLIRTTVFELSSDS